MREMKPEEIDSVVNRAKWATICTVTPNNHPYAVEATPFPEAGDICFMINPRGCTWQNLLKNRHVLIKYTLTNRNLSWWAGVSCEGEGRFDNRPEAVRRGFQLLGEVMETDYSLAGDKHARNPDRSPLLRVTVLNRTGRCSAMPGETLIPAIDHGK